MRGRYSRLPTIAALAVLALLAGCGSNTATHNPNNRSAQSPHLGVLGQLPTPAPRGVGARLTLPNDLINVPGQFPLGAKVIFSIPIANNGTSTLRIAKVDPG